MQFGFVVAVTINMMIYMHVFNVYSSESHSRECYAVVKFNVVFPGRKKLQTIVTTK